MPFRLCRFTCEQTVHFSYGRGHPLNFQIGFGEVIVGWDKGLLGMVRSWPKGDEWRNRSRKSMIKFWPLHLYSVSVRLESWSFLLILAMAIKAPVCHNNLWLINGHNFCFLSQGGIPGNATLIFEIQLLDIKDGAKPPNVFKEVDTNGDKKLSKDEVRFSYFRRANSTSTDRLIT